MQSNREPGRLPTGVVTMLLSACVFIVACGGGGGSAPPEPPPVIDLGMQSATLPSQIGRSFLNPLSDAAVVTALPAAGPLAFGSSNLGFQVQPRGNVSLDLVFTPVGPGAATEVLTLRWTSTREVIDQQFEVRATAEDFGWTHTPDPVDFGDVLPGDAHEVDVEVRNNSQRSPVTLTNGQVPNAAFTFVGTPFPQSVPPGASATVRVRFAPTAASTQGGTLRLGVGDVGGPVNVPLWANSTGSGEQVIDFGTQSLDGAGRTPELTFDVPPEAVSITLEGRMSPSAEVGLRLFEGPSGRVYENAAATGALLWQEARTTFSTHIPSTDGVATQLVAGGGTYRFQLYRFSGAGNTMDVRVIVERRASGNDSANLPLNVFLAPGIEPTAATAATHTQLQAVIGRMDTALQTQGIRLGDITYYDIADPGFDNITQGEEVQLFRTSSIASKPRLNLFFVQTVWAGQVLGLSGAIDGARRNGDGVSGVVVQFFQLAADTIGLVAAHEVCHYLGLWHTVESTGAWDLINDTVECPANGTSATCSVAGGGLLMHWQLLGGTTLTTGQGVVLRAHAHMHPPGQLNQKPTAPSKPISAKARLELEHLPHGWCGTRCR